jgi:monoamine oxidase
MMASLDADVVVIGAGMAGLACASALHSAGRRVIVMEASFHIGGRIRTVREAALNGAERALPASHGGWMRFHSATNSNRPLGVDNFPFEVGGEFVHGTDTPLNHLLDAEKAELKELFTWAHGDGGPSEHPAHDGGIGMYWIGAEKRMMRFDAQDDDHKQMVAALWSLGERSISELRASEGQSLYDYLKSKGVTERAMKFAENGYANTVGGTLNKISASRMSQCEKNWAKDGDGDYRVGKGGLDEVAVRAMARDLDIRRGVPVSKIVRSPECVVVTSTSKGGLLLRAATVVVAVPIPVPFVSSLFLLINQFSLIYICIAGAAA